MLTLRRYSLVALSFLLLSATVYGQQAPLSAGEVMKQARRQAALEKKNILLIFHASWCGWCHKMDSSINDKACKEFFNNNYVIRHLVVEESKDKKNLENPGAYELLSKYHGEEGLPFWLIFDKEGHLLADSQIRPEGASMDSKGENVGCPAAEKEVTYFIAVLRNTSNINASQAAAIQQRFRQNED